jgi:hypothetical protein
MTQQTNLDGTVLFISDADPAVTQLEAAGKTPDQLEVDYIIFKRTWPLAWCKTCQLAALLAYLQNYLNLSNFVDGGTATNVTGTGVGTFLADLTNNYRTKKQAIQNATTSAQVWAVDFQTGWPSNP